MRCDEHREAVSAALDGEAPGTTTTALDDHRATCAACRAWEDDVVALTRRVRVREADGAPAGFVAEVLERTTLPAVRTRRRTAVLRWALAGVGLVQAGLAAPALFHDDLGMAMSEHASHESAAWNLAVAAALLLVAARPRRVGGALAAVGTFVVVLLVLSVLDVVAGRVGPERLVTHAAVLAGAVLLVLLQRTLRHQPEGLPLDPAQLDPVLADPVATQESDSLRTWADRASPARTARPRRRGREVA